MGSHGKFALRQAQDPSHREPKGPEAPTHSYALGWEAEGRFEFAVGLLRMTAPCRSRLALGFRDAEKLPPTTAPRTSAWPSYQYTFSVSSDPETEPRPTGSGFLVFGMAGNHREPDGFLANKLRTSALGIFTERTLTAPSRSRLRVTFWE